jgi:(E)-4-hydroxy-3-methylbut-2-enyl-diphosphate synthase
MTTSAATANPSLSPSYTTDPFLPSRRLTREVLVGDIGIGGRNPIRVQSMTTTATKDVEGTAAQVIRLVQAGCEIVRITAPTPADARAIGEIRARVRAQGVRVPLVADIHFSPAAALEAVKHVEKVRINPGNFADSRKFAVREYSDREYEEELERIAARFTPLVLACKERGVALRIGTNHGSLSDRIMNRFGDSPLGMVESALEFVRICEAHGFQAIVLSMKASNPTVMIAAYRLLVARMNEAGMAYPLHLGVTEAGNGDDARIKSATGIGSLLLDGLGDTIRVSLAEEPEEEIPVARAIVASCARPFAEELPAGATASLPLSIPWDPLSFARRETQPVAIGSVQVGGSNLIAVAGTVPAHQPVTLPMFGESVRKGQRPDLLVLDVETPADLDHLRGLSWKGQGPAPRPLIARSPSVSLLASAVPHVEGLCLVVNGANVAETPEVPPSTSNPLWLALDITPLGVPADASAVAQFAILARERQAALLSVRGAGPWQVVRAVRLLVAHLAALELPLPIVLEAPPGDAPMLTGAASLGSLLCDGLGDAMHAPTISLSFDLLQGAGARLTRTDYVACPSCGRTLFDLQSTTNRIKARTSHLSGVKIAIMGCVVNGPGEMADADFGYMGGSPGHVNLYVGKECVERAVPEAEADERLIALIKTHGRWTDPTPDGA